MKIYKSTQNESDAQMDNIKSLLDNNLSLNEKIENFINSFELIKTTHGGIEFILFHIFTFFNGNVYFPRKGDNNERFDGLVDFNTYNIVFEIETSSLGILNAPRNLLDDYAVVISRHKNITKPIPVVICWTLPNKRTDYWNVIFDVKNILSIRIKTISILAIALHYWTNTPLTLNNDYYLDCYNTTMDIANSIILTNNLVPEKFKGYLSPVK